MTKCQILEVLDFDLFVVTPLSFLRLALALMKAHRSIVLHTQVLQITVLFQMFLSQYSIFASFSFCRRFIFFFPRNALLWQVFFLPFTEIIFNNFLYILHFFVVYFMCVLEICRGVFSRICLRTSWRRVSSLVADKIIRTSSFSLSRVFTSLLD